MSSKRVGLNTYNLAYTLLILILISFGVIIRVLYFPDIPPGFNQDEANSAYEAFSLATTGKDRWGNIFPAYFPSWGSGQNVLLAYISIPFIKAYGLSVFSARLPAVLIGIATLPLFFFSLRPFGRFSAFLGLLLLAVVPWHFMISRWGLESNIVPFFMLLGCGILTQALIKNKPVWIIPSLLPFALALYAYGTTILILPVFFLAILILHRKKIWTQSGHWLLASSLFLLTAIPFLIFFTENYILGYNLSWTDQLFFSTPMLVSTRLSQVRPGTWWETLHSNLFFIRTAFSDGTAPHVLHGYKILLRSTLPLILLGPLCAAYRLFKNKLPDYYSSEDTTLSVFFVWACASLVLVFAFTLNINRFNHFYIPSLALSAWVAHFILEKSKSSLRKQILRVSIATLFISEGGLAVKSYFTNYPRGEIKQVFNTGLQEAFYAVEKITEVNQVLITRRIPLPDVYTLFYLKYPPARFQREAVVEIHDGEYKVNRFGKYIFYKQYINIKADYGYLSTISEAPVSKTHRKNILFRNKRWEVGIMKAQTD